MIATISADVFCAGPEAPKTRDSGTGKTDGSFLDLMKQSRTETVKRVPNGKKAAESDEGPAPMEKTKEDEPIWGGLEAALVQISGLLQQRNSPEGESVKQAIDTVTDILEGKILPSDKDIASLMETMQKGFSELTDGEKEQIMARMPQLTGIMQEQTGPAADKVNIHSLYPCPLENASEQSQEIDSHPTFSLTPGNRESAAESSPAVKAVVAPEQTVEPADSPSGKESGGSGTLPEEPKMTNSAETARAADTADTVDATDAADTVDTADRSGLEAAVSPDAFQSVKQESAVAERCPVTDIMTRMEETILSYDRAGEKQLEIQLEPENLGKLSIHLSMGNDGIKARISTEDSRVQSLLAGGLNELLNKLNDNGISVKSVDVICADLDWQQPGGQGNSQNGNGQNGFSGRGRDIDCVQAAFDIAGGADIQSWLNGEILGSSVVYYA